MFSNHKIECLCLAVLICFLGSKTVFAVSGSATMTAVPSASSEAHFASTSLAGAIGTRAIAALVPRHFRQKHAHATRVGYSREDQAGADKNGKSKKGRVNQPSEQYACKH